MENTFNEIQAIPILDILQRCGIIYRTRGDVIELYHQGKKTDGYRGTIKDNYINDLSGKGRPKGGPYSFVQQYYSLSKKETFEWFKEHYQIGSDWHKKKKPPLQTTPFTYYSIQHHDI